MKAFLLLATLISFFNCHAQDKNIHQRRILLSKGQIVTAVTSADSKSSLKGNTKNIIVTSLLTVINSDTSDYTLSSLISKISSGSKGQETIYDASQALNQNSDIKNHFNERIIIINKVTGKSKHIEPDITTINKNESPAEEDMPWEMFGQNIADDAFLIIPFGTKPGDSWTVRDSTPTLTRNITYSIFSVNGDSSRVQFRGNSTVLKTLKTSNMDVYFKTNNVLTGDIDVNTTSSLVGNKTTNIDSEGVVELMDQSTKMNSKTKISSSYHFN